VAHDTSELEREIAESRAELAATADQLAARLRRAALVRTGTVLAVGLGAIAAVMLTRRVIRG
jgi:hypothetical protein